MANRSVQRIFDAELDAWIRKIIGREVAGMVEEYFTKERVQTNRWGEGTGGSEALGDAVIAKVQKHLTLSDQHSSNRGSKLDTMVYEVLFKPLEQQLKKELAKVRNDQSEKAISFVARMMADSMKVIGNG